MLYGGAARTISVWTVRCPACASHDDKVVDSRAADLDAAIRRRRECLACGHRFTTFERVEDRADAGGLIVAKRSGQDEPFDRTKIVAGLKAAAKNRPVSDIALGEVATEVEETLRAEGGQLTSERVGLAVLEALRDLDQVAYLRFASVYKEFDDAADFERELMLLTKTTEPKRR